MRQVDRRDVVAPEREDRPPPEEITPPHAQQILALQRSAGNQAVVAALRTPPGRALQRAGPDTVVESAVWSELMDEFFEYTGSMAVTNASYPTVTRTRWNAAFSKLWAEAGEPGSRPDAELTQLKQAFARLEDLFVDLNTEANDLWVDLDQECQEELQDLMSSPLPEDVVAAEVLSDLYAKTSQRVDMTGEHLVPEDLVPLHHMLENGTHIAQGRQSAERERARRERLEDEFADEDEVEEPGVAEQLWDVVGWDSAGEFAADVGLTIVSGGLGKIAKVVVKGRKASKKLAKLNRLRKLRKARQAERAKQLATGMTNLLRAVKDVMKSGAADHVAWVKKNWKNTARAYLTDEIGEAGAGDATEAKTVLERYSKDRVTDFVGSTFGLSSAEEAKQLQTALLLFAVGANKQGETDLRRYFQLNLKRRGLSNTIYYAVRTGTLETKLTPAVAADLTASVAGEMAQDFVVNATGANGVDLAVLEATRKTIQVSVAGWLKDAFASD